MDPEPDPYAEWAGWEIENERACSLADNPPMLGRTIAGPDNHEVLLVPVIVDPELDVSASAIAVKRGDPLRWQPARQAAEGTQGVVSITVEGEDEIVLRSAWRQRAGAPLVEARITTDQDGQLIAALTLQTYWPCRLPTDPSPYFDDLRGELRLSRDPRAVGEELAVHLEVGLPSGSMLCVRSHFPPPTPGNGSREYL